MNIHVVKFLLPFRLKKRFECNETSAMRDVYFSNSKSHFEHKSTNENCVIESSVTGRRQRKCPFEFMHKSRGDNIIVIIFGIQLELSLMMVKLRHYAHK